MYQRFHVSFRLPAMHRGELSAAITQLMCKCLWSGWKRLKVYKEMASRFTCCPVNREYSWKKSRIEKQKQKSKLYFTTCKNRLSVDEEHLESFMDQWIGFYMTRTSIMKELMLCYWHVFIEIYSLIMTK